MRIKTTFLLFIIYGFTFSQKGKIYGFVYDETESIIPNATIYFDSIDKIIYSNSS